MKSLCDTCTAGDTCEYADIRASTRRHTFTIDDFACVYAVTQCPDYRKETDNDRG